jgi:hypothetical protein
MRVCHNTASINRTDARVRAFLSEIEHLDALLHPARKKPLFLAKYNFPSLLRAAGHSERFGNIRDLHEGGIEGEAMVKKLRPLVPNGLKDRFATHLLAKAFRDYTLDRVMRNLDQPSDISSLDESDSCVLVTDSESNNSDDDSDSEEVEDLENEDSDTEPDPCENRRHVLEEPDDTADKDMDPLEAGGTHETSSSLLFRRCSSRAVVEKYLQMGVPMSAVITNQKGTHRMGVVVAKCNEWWLLPLFVHAMRFDDQLGFTYFDIRLHPPEENRLLKTKEDGKAPYFHIRLLNFVSLLPALWLAEPIPYALLTMEGEHLNAEYNFI